MRSSAVAFAALIAMAPAALTPALTQSSEGKTTAGQCRDAAGRNVGCVDPSARTDAEGVPLPAKAAAARDIPKGRPLGPAAAAPPGAIAECRDGTFVMSGADASCAQHGGVGQRLKQGPAATGR